MRLARGRARLVGRPPFGFGRQVFQNFSVGAGEGTTAQLIQRTPAAGLNCAGQSIGKIGAKDFQRYPIARDGMADPKQLFEGARAGAEEPFSELTNVAMIEGDFDIRKLPQVRVDDTGWASANGEATATFSNERDKAAFSQGSLLVEVGQFGHTVLAERDAMFSHGAERTLRLARGANRGAQFHQSLVEMRTGRFDGSTGSRPTRFMGSLHDFRITHRDHEPATDRSADSLVRECLGLDSCGHGCPRSDSRFMESLLSLLRTHWDHEPLRLTEARSGPRVCDPQPARFMESLLARTTAHASCLFSAIRLSISLRVLAP